MELEQETTFANKKEPKLLSLLFDNKISIWKYILRSGLISLVPSVVVSMILGMTGIITEETVPSFEGGVLYLSAMLIIFGPLSETLLLAGGLWLLSFITKHRVWLAVFSAIIWAVVHSLLAPIWGLCVIWPFFVFSCSYLAWRKRSWWHAILITSGIHAFQNALPTIGVIANH